MRRIECFAQDLERPRTHVLSARDGYASASDRTLPDLAYREERVLITEDKDFGELVFSLRLPHPCIVRFHGLTTTDEAAAI